MSELGDLWPYLMLVLVGFLPNEIWRMLGVVVARRIDENSEVIHWVRAVATAILTGVVAKIVMFAPGALASVPLPVRLGAAAIGMTAFFLIRQSVFAGVATGTAAIVVGVLIFG
jgi:hypothetical protein